MLRNKKPARPLFPTKHEFTASLDAYIAAVHTLASAAEFVIQYGDDPKAMKTLLPKLKEAHEAYRKATYTED